mmetsp:Transcript_8375/g.18105  ORF Transcript_8375/g.18105 Transcript_8375/m.18105 type:complete len:265 (+) Transcript_8375:591-1385(+)
MASQPTFILPYAFRIHSNASGNRDWLRRKFAMVCNASGGGGPILFSSFSSAVNVSAEETSSNANADVRAASQEDSASGSSQRSVRYSSAIEQWAAQSCLLVSTRKRFRLTVPVSSQPSMATSFTRSSRALIRSKTRTALSNSLTPTRKDASASVPEDNCPRYKCNPARLSLFCATPTSHSPSAADALPSPADDASFAGAGSNCSTASRKSDRAPSKSPVDALSSPILPRTVDKVFLSRSLSCREVLWPISATGAWSRDRNTPAA